MATPKTTRNDGDVGAFLDAVTHAERREDARAVCALMAEVTGEPPELWGTAIVGFGTNRYRNGSGKVVEWPVIAFSPRKQSLTIYLMDGFEGREDLLDALGPHTIGRACLYVKHLCDVDLDVLRALLVVSVEHIRATSLPPP
ncbi:MAG: DUF1801 domain-containing protein [Acidimicrobiales bacterium]|jgi:hypothetical protein|nr:DUF1801 domain-containing protein [Acidimicrobiales bacterium]